MIFHWNLSDSKSFQVSRTLLSILADLNNTLVCMISILPPTTSLSSIFFRFLGTVQSTLSTIGMTDTLFHNFFQLSGKI